MYIGTYNQLIESLEITFMGAKNIKIIQACTVENFRDVVNFAMLLHHGQITYTQHQQQHTVKAGDILLIPGGQSITITYGKQHPVKLANHFVTSSNQHFQGMGQHLVGTTQFDHFSYVAFDARVLDTSNCLATWGIPAFTIKDHQPLRSTLQNILQEYSTTTAGNHKMIHWYTGQLVIEMMRHLIKENFFTAQLNAQYNCLQDPRLIRIVKHIKNNLRSELSNNALATVAHISEDYVGQYFKMRTGINPQAYIEYQRMKQAVKLLRHSSKSIRDISGMVGFKDTAYFCRRFKQNFGVSAGKMRSPANVMSC